MWYYDSFLVSQPCVFKWVWTINRAFWPRCPATEEWLQNTSKISTDLSCVLIVRAEWLIVKCGSNCKIKKKKKIQSNHHKLKVQYLVTIEVRVKHIHTGEVFLALTTWEANYSSEASTVSQGKGSADTYVLSTILSFLLLPNYFLTAVSIYTI